MKKLLLLFGGFAGVALAQNPTICNVTNKQTTGYVLTAVNGQKTCHWAVGGSGSGTVTSFSGSGPSWLTWTVATPTTTPAVTLAPTTGQTSHQVIGTCGSGTIFVPCNLLAADLPSTAVTPATYGDATHVGQFTVDQQGRLTFAASLSITGVISGLTTTKIPKATSATAIGDSSITDNGTTVSTTEPVTAPSFSSGGSPPTCTAGTGGCEAMAEGTAPSVGPLSGVDVCYADSTQHGRLCSLNNGSYLPIPQAPASTTSSDLACWNATNGGLLKDCTALPSTTTATTQSANSNDTKVATDAYVDATKCTTTTTTGTTGTISTCFTVNQEGTAATGVTYTLPTAANGLQYCIDNGYNGSAANTGVLTFSTSASGQFMVFTDGSLTATGGNVTSGGAARDGACVYGIDSTHWMFLPHSGTWAKH